MDARIDHSDRTEAVRCLLAMPRLDFETAMALLNTLPVEAVRYAREAVAAAPGGDHRHEAIARFTLARVLVALEAEQVIAVLPPVADA